MKKVMLLCLMCGLLNGVACVQEVEIALPDGAKYVGQWRNDKRHGKGTWTRSDGVQYVGQWKDGKRHGEGTMTTPEPDGMKYVGQWKDDEMHGKGVLYSSDGSIYQKGTFQDGEYVGK